MSTTTCSIWGIVSVPAGRSGYGSDPGCRSGRPFPVAVRHAPVPATAPIASPAFSTPRLAIGVSGFPQRSSPGRAAI